MRQVKVLLVGFLVAVALAATLHAQSYIWSSINGVPYGPGLVLTGKLTLPAGSVSVPAITIGTTPNSGIYSWDGGANDISFTSGGTRVFAFNSSPGAMFILSDGAGVGLYLGAGSDSAIVREGAALLKITNGSTGQGKMLFSVSTEAVTTTKSPGVQEASEVYTNEGDADGATITLPTAAAGLTYTACIQAAQTLTVTAAAGDTIRLASGVTAAAGSISSNVIGSCVTLVAINATEWYGTSIVGSWSY